MYLVYIFDIGILLISSSIDFEKSSVVNLDCGDDIDGNDDECDGDDSMVKKLKIFKNRKRKRKSKFFVFEMFVFLEFYFVRREKVDEEKFKLMKES